MDPIGTLRHLADVVKYLWDVAETMKENKEECRRLCQHTRHIMAMIQEENQGPLSPKLEMRLCKLTM